MKNKGKFIYSRYIDSESRKKFAELKTGAVIEVQVAPQGDFFTHHQVSDGFSLDDQSFDKFVENFNNKAIKNEIALYEGHDLAGEDRPAVGWVTDLINKGSNGLWALVELTKKGAQLIADKEFKYISPEWFFEYMEPETGSLYENVISGLALTNEPYFSQNAPITASKNNQTSNQQLMNVDELLQKPVEELTEEEKTFLGEHKEELTDEQREKLAPIFAEEKEDAKEEGAEGAEKQEEAEEGAEEAATEGEGEEESTEDEATEAEAESGDEEGDSEEGEAEESEESAEDDAEAESEDDAQDGDAAPEESEAPEEGGEKVEASKKDKAVTLKASEYKRLTAAEQELAQVKLTASYKGMGFVKSVFETAAKFSAKLTPQLREEFNSVMETAAKCSVGMNTERKTASTKQDAPAAENVDTYITEAAKKIQASEEAEGRKITLSKAIEKVYVEQPELKEKREAAK